MLSDDAERYIALRRSLGYKLRKVARHLQSFAAFATDRGETHVRAATATAWAATTPTLRVRARRLAEVTRFARFLQAEDAAHEVPTVNPFAVRETRPMPLYLHAGRDRSHPLPPANFGGRNRTRCGASFMSCCSA